MAAQLMVGGGRGAGCGAVRCGVRGVDERGGNCSRCVETLEGQSLYSMTSQRTHGPVADGTLVSETVPNLWLARGAAPGTDIPYGAVEPSARAPLRIRRRRSKYSHGSFPREQARACRHVVTVQCEFRRARRRRVA